MTFTETYRAAEAQMRTLGAQAYNLSLIPRRGGQTEFKPHVTSKQILNNIKYISAKNRNFFDVIITPLHKCFFYLLVDDIRDYGAVLELGPIYAQETSAGSRQAVIMLPGDAAARGPDWDAARLLVSELNRTFGDPAVASPQQPMRLTGFRNMKPNRNGELVTALLLEPHAHASQAILDRWAELRQQQRQPQRPYAAGSATRPTQLPELPRREITAAFQEALQRHRAETADKSAADYRAICELIRAGYDPDALKAELAAVSERKHSPREYATRTVDRVVQRYIEYTTK